MTRTMTNRAARREHVEEFASLDTNDTDNDTAFFKYKNPYIKRCVWDFKYYLKKDALRLMADIYSDEIIALLSDRVSKIPFSLPVYIIYAPSSSYISGKRSWDQMRELSNALLDRMNPECPFVYVCHEAVVQHTRSASGSGSRSESGLKSESGLDETKSEEKAQHEKTRAERLSSTRDKYKLSEEFIKKIETLLHTGSARSVRAIPQIICLDDVTTTGATFEAIQALIERDTGLQTVCVAFCH